jgi:type IX secretion system PorP/SprF family membrane protein
MKVTSCKKLSIIYSNRVIVDYSVCMSIIFLLIFTNYIKRMIFAALCILDRKMKKTLIPSVLIMMACALNAQISPQVSHFMYDQLRTNPGSAGSMDMICASFIGRTQMVGFPGAPTSIFFNVEAPFKLFGTQHGVGISICRDELGKFTNTDFGLNYAYRFTVGNGTLGLGVQAGFIDAGIKDPNDWIPPDGQSISNDPNIPQSDPNGLTFNLGAGLFYRTEDIYFGVSSINLNNPEIKSPPSGAGNVETKYNLIRQYYVTAGYNMQLTNPAYEIRPAVLLKSDAVSTDMDINVALVYNKKIWGGVTYRTGEAIIGLLGIELFEGLKVGFAYDFMTSALSKNTQSYEVLLNCCFKIGIEKAPQKYKSIRFL